MSEETKQLKVSKEFVDIFKNFNVVNVVEDMKLLSKKELYLLLTVCLDKHDDEQPTVVYNFQPFREEVMEIFEIQDDKETLNPILQILIEESGDKYIETDNIVDVYGKKLPDPLTKEEVRDAKINIINDNNLI
jgi:hypothetical protein